MNKSSIKIYNVIQGAVQTLAVIGCYEPRAQCLAEPRQCQIQKISLNAALGILGSPTPAPGVLGSGDPTTPPVRVCHNYLDVTLFLINRPQLSKE